MTAQQHAAVILALLDPALGVNMSAFDLDAVPSPRPSRYVEITLSRRFGGNLKQGGSTGIVGYRLTVRAVSDATVKNVRDALERSRAALEFQRLAVTGQITTPIQFETEDPAGYDDGWFSGLMSFTYGF